jgi:UDP-N-acetylglucosamine 2-epimerase (non-hydrolysing)
MARRPLVAHVVGARPNYMKVAPVYAELERRGRVEQRLIHTGQHYDAIMKDVFFAELPLPRPHVQLDARTTESALAELEAVFADLEPDLVVVAGDVNSTLAGAVAARKRGLALCHIESGLRSNDWSMPEERNRVITDHLSTLLLTHSRDADENLNREGIPDERVSLVGNTMIDTLRANEDAARALEAWREFDVEPGAYILVTLHRPSLVDDSGLLSHAIAALDHVAETLPVIFPVHPRTRKNLELDVKRVVLTEPLPYRQFLSLETEAAAVVTDSGGIQEETTALDVPCFTLRENTERPITVEVGTNIVLGLQPEALTNIPEQLGKRRTAMPEKWDGRAGERAADEVERLLSLVEIPA